MGKGESGGKSKLQRFGYWLWGSGKAISRKTKMETNVYCLCSPKEKEKVIACLIMWSCSSKQVKRCSRFTVMLGEGV